jgi:hypothetical protein
MRSPDRSLLAADDARLPGGLAVTVWAMTRLCERPGCSRVAEMTYGFDAEHLMVWIDTYDGVANGRDGVLCRRHADAMVVPLGWMLDDRREPAPRLFRAPASTPAVASKPRRGPARHRDDTQQLQLQAAVAEAESETTTQPAQDDKPAEPEVLPWKPMFDHSDDLGGLLEARSPLLARAFGGKRPRHSPSR